ncbi:hypothetical protein [Pseudobacteriovorax antillogorgiicola]|uniref:MetA-pathway of phenol degradation n=1 Tax=Pseudobacteriovorax antillogorgiicola TaxID=1513793 RepID=A0A1Y6B895_9BACT|nr:hypothetical protein [Pseudobacteriovorax antillogorgiicola]TCS58691.1 hypothetical protein EDD56_102204 [Pseudobacteriovorax antillogorgiicola]SME95788.1 hypothetical protein SAMN06296036_102239 [Pseudobacteriovorax antillogorgiicola]
MKTLLALLLLSATPLAAADLTMSGQLSEQHKSRTVSAQSLPKGQWTILSGLEFYKSIELLNHGAFGQGSRFNLGLQRGIKPYLSAGVNFNLVTEDEANQDLGYSLPISQGQASFDLKVRLFDAYGVQAAVVPFIQTGLGPKHHFLIKSKSQVGAIFAIQAGPEWLQLIANTYARYRPLDVHNNYRVSGDWGSSAMLRSDWGVWGLYAEIAEQNTEILDLNLVRHGYQLLVAQQHTVGLDFNLGDSQIALFAKRAIKDKTIGIAAQTFGMQFSIKVQDDLPDPLPLQDEPKPQEPGLSPGEKIYQLDQIRQEMVDRNKGVGSETEHLQILEEGRVPSPPEPSRQELIQEADEELEKMADVEKRIETKYGPIAEPEPEPLNVSPLQPQPSISH